MSESIATFRNDHIVIGITSKGLAVSDAIHDELLYTINGIYLDINIIRTVAANTKYVVIVTNKYITQFWYNGEVSRYRIPHKSTINLNNVRRAIVTPLSDSEYTIELCEPRNIINWNRTIE